MLALVAVAAATLAPGTVPDVAAAGAPGAPVALEFQVQPGDGLARAPLPRQPVVRVVDAAGNTVTTSHAAVLLSQYGQGPVMGCFENPVRAIDGIATFHGCTVWSGPARGNQVRATAYHLDAAVSAPFDVGSAGPEPAVRVLFNVGNGIDVGPFTASAGGPIWFDVRVRVADDGYRTITTGAASTLPVTLSIAPNAAGAIVTCPGGATVPAVAGIATFTGCSVSTPGLGLRFTASADGVAPTWSFPIDVWPPGTPQGPNLWSLETSSGEITWGSPVALRLRLRPTAAGQKVAGRIVHIQVSDSPYELDSWRTIGDVTTDATGAATFGAYRPAANHYYRALFDGADDLGPAISLVTRIIVRIKLVVRPTSGYPPRAFAPGTRVTFRAIVRPARPGTPPTSVTWEVRHYVDGRGTTTWSTSIPDARGVVALPVTFTRGSWVIRVRVHQTVLNANSSPTYDRYVVR